MLNNSTLTLEDTKAYLNRRLDDQSIVDDDIIDATNDYYAIVQRFVRQEHPQKTKLFTGTLVVTTSGYDLSLITDLGTMDFVVYRDSVKTQNILYEKLSGSSELGYYTSGSTLYLTGDTEASIVIEYNKKTDRVVIGSVLADHTLQADQDLEPSFLSYCRETFFDGQYQFDLRNDAENKVKERLAQYFDKPSKVILV